MSLRSWQPPQGYYWKVVYDPTRVGDEPGMFYGGHFRWTDIVLPGWDDETRKIPCPWPSGTVFEHIKTGERVVIRRGRVVRLEGKDIQVVRLMDGCIGGLMLFFLFLTFALSVRKEKPRCEPPPVRVVDARSSDPGETYRTVMRVADEVHGRWYEGRHADEIVHLHLPERSEIARHNLDVRVNLRWLEKEAGDTDVILHYQGEEPIRRLADWGKVQHTQPQRRRRAAPAGVLPLAGLLLMVLVIVGVLLW